ncbi:MAG: flagellar basal body-associated protein FliL [Sphingomonadaceae bacterium]
MKKMLVIGIGGLVLVCGGVGAGLYAAGSGLVSGKHGAVEDPKKPRLVPKDDVKGAPTYMKGNGDGSEKYDRTKYKASYYTMEQPFTSNMRDSDGFMQLGLGISTHYDQRVLDRIKEDEMPIRSAVLMKLASQDGFVISTPEGKKQLQDDLKDAINQVLISKEGFGGVDSVYFTSFIIQ